MRARDWYFQGWEKRPDESGKNRFIYTGEYYRFDGSIATVRIVSVGLSVLLCALFLYLSFHPSNGGMWRFAAIPQLLELIPLLYLLIGAVQLLLVREPLTFRDYYASWRRMLISAYWSIGFTALVVLAELAYLVLVAERGSFASEALYLLGEIVCLALSFLLALYIRRHPCTPSVALQEKENPHV